MRPTLPVRPVAPPPAGLGLVLTLCVGLGLLGFVLLVLSFPLSSVLPIHR